MYHGRNTLNSTPVSAAGLNSRLRPVIQKTRALFQTRATISRRKIATERSGLFSANYARHEFRSRPPYTPFPPLRPRQVPISLPAAQPGLLIPSLKSNPRRRHGLLFTNENCKYERARIDARPLPRPRAINNRIGAN